MARDETWKSAEGTWGRLKWARLQKFETAKDAAIAFGVEVGTYRAYEREPGSSKHTPLGHQHAAHFAKRLGIRWEWLLSGEGIPWRDPDEIKDRVLQALDNAPPERRAAIADAIESLLKAG